MVSLTLFCQSYMVSLTGKYYSGICSPFMTNITLMHGLMVINIWQ